MAVIRVAFNYSLTPILPLYPQQTIVKLNVGRWPELDTCFEAYFQKIQEVKVCDPRYIQLK